MSRTKSETARAKMVDTARELVLDVGLHGFSIDEVSRRSGVAKTTIYRHFPKRDVLLLAAIDSALPNPPVPNTGSLYEDLMVFLPEIMPTFSDDRLRVVFYELWAAASRDPDLAQLYGAMMGRRALPTRTIYDNGRLRGEIGPDISYAEAFEIMEGPFVVRSVLNPTRMDALDIEELVKRMVVLLLG